MAQSRDGPPNPPPGNALLHERIDTSMKLNIGCGEKRSAGWLNIDKYDSGFQDLIGDVEGGIPLADACADEILLDNVIEHVDSIPAAMREIRRLLKPGGRVTIMTPHFSSDSSWRDPTHRWHLSVRSFDMFCRARNAHYLGGALFKPVQRNLSFGGGFGLLGRLLFKLSPELYEKHFCYIFRGSTITVVLEAC